MSGHIDLQEMNRSLRDAVRRHANFQTMTESLSPHTRQIVDALLSGDVTPQMVRTARLAPPQEFDRYTFLRALDGGNPSPVVAEHLTNVVLGYLEMGLDEFWEYQPDE